MSVDLLVFSDKIELGPAEQAKLPIVTDTNSNIVLIYEDGLVANGIDAEEELEKELAPKKRNKGKKGGKGKSRERDMGETSETPPRVLAAAQQKVFYTDDKREENENRAEGEGSGHCSCPASKNMVWSQLFSSYNEEGVDDDKLPCGESSSTQPAHPTTKFVEVDGLTSPPKGARTLFDKDYKGDNSNNDNLYETCCNLPPILEHLSLLRALPTQG
ncbi:hypothetical protein AAF712_016080 [Marasmius tenuissimus]|uniref:Uncharacterized protein n=1 Tax=Marasmius tenuissimus TaxID=585030 RepID=A0ABR2Z7N9_9AGAR|nr:hypothetical protein PM082_000084 [Marasmius tenuissimus]